MTDRSTTAPRDESTDVAVLEAVNVSRTYKSRHQGEVHALTDVTLRIHRGDAIGLVGESGSGKTTLTRLLLGLERPDAGSVHFRGRPVDSLDPGSRRDFRHSVSAVFQNPYSSLDPRMRIWRAITEQSAIERTASKRERHSRARDLLDIVGLPREIEERFPHQLSGGQRQRVAIARAIAADPDIVILDEPVSALDVSVSAQIINLLLDIQDELGVAYVFVAHDMSLVRHLCHEVTVLFKGRAVDAGVTEDVLGAPRDPYTVALMNASKLESLELPTDVELPGELLQELDAVSIERHNTELTHTSSTRGRNP